MVYALGCLEVCLLDDNLQLISLLSSVFTNRSKHSQTQYVSNLQWNKGDGGLYRLLMV